MCELSKIVDASHVNGEKEEGARSTKWSALHANTVVLRVVKIDVVTDAGKRRDPPGIFGK
jgi:hypothetical protein